MVAFGMHEDDVFRQTTYEVVVDIVSLGLLSLLGGPSGGAVVSRSTTVVGSTSMKDTCS